MSNRRWIGVSLLVLLLVAAGIGIGVGAYHAGFVHGAVANGARIVYAAPYVHAYGWGFFPFGFLLFPLFLILLFVGLRLALGGPRRWYGGGWGGPGGSGAWGTGGPRERLDAWHREAHGAQRASSGTGESGGAPSSA